MKRTSARSAVGALAFLTMLLAATPALAHDDEANLVVTATQPVDQSTVQYTVRLTFRNDGHGAKGATVTAVAEGPGGASVAPVTLAPAAAEGDYQGQVAFPSSGSWQVRFTAVAPAATIVQAQEITIATTTSEPPSTTASTEAAAPDDEGAAQNSVGSSVDSGGSGAGAVAFFAVIGGMIAIAALAFISSRRARRARAAQA